MAARDPDVRFVVLSDLHLGEAASLLTPPTGGAPALDALAAGLADLVAANRRGAATLVLAGDTLGLAFGRIERALDAFGRLVSRLFAGDAFDRVVIVPGNHDHHLWEVAREAAWTRALGGGPVMERPASRRPAAALAAPPPARVTGPRASDGLPDPVLEAVARRALGSCAPRVASVYPVLAVDGPEGRRRVVVHHGHYLEPAYHAVTRVWRALLPDRPEPTTVEEIEAQNGAWIDFVWSGIGRSGAVGPDAEELVRTLRDPDRLADRLGDLARGLAGALDGRLLPEAAEAALAARAIEVAGRRVRGARYRRGGPLGAEVEAGLRGYLMGPALRHVEAAAGLSPDRLLLVFGHTHKPLVGSIDAGGRSVRLVNTGGWTLDALAPDPAKGAAALLLDDGLEAVLLDIWSDGDERDVAVRPVNPTASDLAAAVRRRTGVAGRSRAVWGRLTRVLADEAARRRDVGRPDAGGRLRAGAGGAIPGTRAGGTAIRQEEA